MQAVDKRQQFCIVLNFHPDKHFDFPGMVSISLDCLRAQLFFLTPESSEVLSKF